MTNRKGTFSVQHAGTNSAAHNSRTSPPRYLIGLQPNTKNYYELIQSDEDFKIEAKHIYQNKIGQKMQRKQIDNIIQETAITLKKEHDENTVKDLFKKLKSKFGGHTLLELSVHRDEGHYEKDNIAYYPTKTILKKNDGKFYILPIEKILEVMEILEKDKDYTPRADEFTVEVDINMFEKVYNYHAHAKFSMFDKSTGKTARLQKRHMSARIKFVSDQLGLKFAPNEKTSRIKKSVSQIKNEYHIHTIRKIEQQYSYRDYQKKITAFESLTTEQKKELHRLNTQVKNDKATLEILNKAIEASQVVQYELDHTKNLLNTSEIRYEALKQQTKELRDDLMPLNEISSTNTPSTFMEWIKNKFTEFKQIINNLKIENQMLRERLDDIHIPGQEQKKVKNILSSIVDSAVETQKLTNSFKRRNR